MNISQLACAILFAFLLTAHTAVGGSSAHHAEEDVSLSHLEEEEQQQPHEEQQQQPSTCWDVTPGLTRSCSYFPPGEVDVSEGELTFLKPITCDSPKMLYITDDVILRSHASIIGTNIHFVVEKGVSLTISTRGCIVFERDEDTTFPLFQVKGKLILDAGGWMEQHSNGRAVDHSYLLRLSETGSITTYDTIHYGANSVMVADVSVAGMVDKDGIKVIDAPRPTSISDDSNNNNGSSTGTSIGMDGTSSSDSTSGNISHSIGMGSTTDNIDSSTSSIGSNKKIFTLDSSSSSNRLGAGGTSRRKWIDRSHSDRTAAGGTDPLRVGEDRIAPIRSLDGQSIWTGNDGSIIHFMLPDANAPSPSDDGGAIGARAMQQVRRVVSSDSRRLEDVLRTRSTVKKAGERGVSLKDAAPGGFWSLGARRRLRKMETAAESMYQRVMSIDERGAITVTIDGAPVLTNSGPHKSEWRNKFPFRRARSQSYEMHPTEDGFEVTLEGRVIWGVQAADIM